MSSNASGGDSTGRFSDDLEKLIARAGAKVDRSGKSSKAVVSAGEEGAVVRHAAGGELEGRGQEEDGAEEGVEGGASSELSARAMKFRAMISKLRPQKKTILVKASIMYRSLSDWCRVISGTLVPDTWYLVPVPGWVCTGYMSCCVKTPCRVALCVSPSRARTCRARTMHWSRVLVPCTRYWYRVSRKVTHTIGRISKLLFSTSGILVV